MQREVILNLDVVYWYAGAGILRGHSKVTAGSPGGVNSCPHVLVCIISCLKVISFRHSGAVQ